MKPQLQRHPQLEMQTHHPHSGPAESDALGRGPGLCVFMNPPREVFACLNVGTTVPGRGPADPDSGSHGAGSHSLM